jgi:hypothetical protein
MAKVYTGVSSIEPIKVTTNSNIVVVFVPFDGTGVLDNEAQVVFEDPGDITVPGSQREQIVLDVGGTTQYQTNGQITQGELSFPYVPDPSAGPPVIPDNSGEYATSPQGVLFIAKKIVSGTAKSLKTWGVFPCNAISFDALSWAKSQTQSATARFQVTGEGAAMGYTKTSDSGTLSYTAS